MRLTPFMLAALVSAASAAAQPQPPAPAPARPPIAAPPSLGTGICLRDLRRDARAKPVRPRSHRLGELPPGDLQLSVMREVDGCPEPAIVREDFGAVRGDGRR